jgi:hypothetical protein
VRAAYARDSTLVSANDTTATAKPPINTDETSLQAISGSENAGKPCGSAPRTETPARASRSKAPTTSVAATTAIRIAGMRGRRCSSRMASKVPAPMANATVWTLPARTPFAVAHTCSSGPSACTEKPSSFGTWLRITVKAIPFM